jgi:hypothetical protein
MMNEFIPYEVALEIKQLGFNEPCFCVYNREKQLRFNNLHNPQDRNKGVKLTSNNGRYPAPTYSQAFKFFREKYNLVHEISWGKYKGGVSFDYDIFSLVLPTDDELGDENDIYIEKPMETYDSLAEKTFRDRESDSYEEAELACLIKLIEICKNT